MSGYLLQFQIKGFAFCQVLVYNFYNNANTVSHCLQDRMILVVVVFQVARHQVFERPVPDTLADVEREF